MEEQRRQAILRNDIKALERLLAPEQTSITSLNAGKVTTRDRELSVNQPETRQLQSWEPKSVDVRLYGNVGMVTGLAEVKDVLRGDTRHFIVQYTHIWVKRNGAWQLVHRHTNRVSTIVGPPPPGFSASGAAGEIVRLLQQWTDAMTRGDAKALDELLADDFTFVSPRGRLILKATYVANRDASRGQIFATESARFDDVSVRFFDGFAVSTSRYTTTSQTKDAGFVEQTSGEYTRIDTWIKVDGRWRALATQLTPIGYAGAHVASNSGALRGVNDGDLKWAESPMYPGAQLAVLYGQPYTGGFAVRMKRPAGHFEKPHHHESDEHVSVLSGTLHIAAGDESNKVAARTFHAGGYVVIPSGTLHHSWTEGEVLTEIHWTGPAAPVAASARTAISLPRATLTSYVGTYRFDDSASTLTIALDGDQLTGRLSGASAGFPIFAESETRFFLKSAPPGSSVGVNQQIEFVKDASGIVIGVRHGNRTATRVPQ